MGTDKTIAEFTANRAPICFAPGDRVVAAVAAMKEHTSDCVLVCESNTVRGVFTQRDFLNRVAAVGKNDAPLGDVMTKDPAVLRENDSIMTALRRMAAGNYRNIPIVDAGGKATANLGIWDVMSHLSERFTSDLKQLGALSIDAIYLRPAVEVETTDRLLDVLNLMMNRSCGAVRVNQDERLAGIFAEQDLMHRIDYSTSEWHSVPVSEVMTKNPVCIERDKTIADALAIMNKQSFRHLPVIDDASENASMVSIREILGFVASRLQG